MITINYHQQHDIVTTFKALIWLYRWSKHNDTAKKMYRDAVFLCHQHIFQGREFISLAELGIDKGFLNPYEKKLTIKH